MMELEHLDYPPQVVQAKQRFGIIGNSPALMESVARAVQVAPIDLSVLVTGESGSGKEFFPKIIHGFSSRKHARYIAVNCGAIPEGTIDSELFGHEKGAFTGAVSTRKGYFEEADGGTIFLDEVAELPLTTQARLLRVLESGEFIKVGSSTVQRANVRIVAATNVDMVRAVSEGRFREDLYYRLSTVSISIPPLRDRGADIPLLARKFAADFAERYTMPRITFDDTARQLLMAYRWPGNVRQLKNVVEQMALFHAGDFGAFCAVHFLVGCGEVKLVVRGIEKHRGEVGSARIEQFGVLDHISGLAMLLVSRHARTDKAYFCYIAVRVMSQIVVVSLGSGGIFALGVQAARQLQSGRRVGGAVSNCILICRRSLRRHVDSRIALGHLEGNLATKRPFVSLFIFIVKFAISISRVEKLAAGHLLVGSRYFRTAA